MLKTSCKKIKTIHKENEIRKSLRQWFLH